MRPTTLAIACTLFLTSMPCFSQGTASAAVTAPILSPLTLQEALARAPRPTRFCARNRRSSPLPRVCATTHAGRFSTARSFRWTTLGARLHSLAAGLILTGLLSGAAISNSFPAFT